MFFSMTEEIFKDSSMSNDCNLPNYVLVLVVNNRLKISTEKIDCICTTFMWTSRNLFTEKVQKYEAIFNRNV